jgi:Domain of unknown function (DUF4397)
MNIRNGVVATLVLVMALAGCGGKGGGKGGDAKIRLLNLSSGYGTLDMITNLDEDDNDEDKTQASSVALNAISAYATLDADTYTIKLKRTGSGSILRSFTGQQLVADTVNTYVGYGEVGQFGALLIDDTADPADAGSNKLSVANVSSAGALDVYLTDADTNLTDTTPVLSSVGSSLAALSTDSGTRRLRVTAAGDNTDVRLDVESFSLPDKGVGTLILTSTQGGTLANAIYLPQGGEPARILNSKARLRGAVALANGANASVRAGGKTVLTATTAGVIGSRYTLLDAGSVPVTLSVNGTDVAVPELTLTAGADYTLLVWSDANGPRTTLIVDDNRLPASGSSVKLRLLNGMSTLAAPLTLSVDFSPLIEGTPTGQASDPVETQGTSDSQFDVSNTSTAAAVLTRTGITLQSGSVYTFFMTDNGATPIGVLRRDR